jgi:hypothetical protein
MTTSLITLVLLGGMLLWIRAWERGSRLASGIVIGAALALVAGPILRGSVAAGPMPVWLPALPFALIALALFGFGLLAWFWGDEPPGHARETEGISRSS